jgi:tRNA-Thr(GGU) m(6)t(6)A37 methyltransferase TsaA
MEFKFNSIGHVICDQNYRYEAPRQGVFADNSGYIKLSERNNFEQALEDLCGFDRIWVIYVLHLNKNWKPKVAPPVTGKKKKIGVFATRSPHRPNPIAISCVELIKIEGLKLFIRNFDMLNMTPVLDIKPYIPVSDSFPDSSTGWLPALCERVIWRIQERERIKSKLEWIYDKTGLDIVNFCRVQLSDNPFDSEKKRVIKFKDGGYSLGYRTWTIYYAADKEKRVIYLIDVKSNYSEDDLLPGTMDKYGDKDIHRAFKHFFG